MKMMTTITLAALLLTGCTAGPQAPARIVADSSCESGQRQMQLGTRPTGHKWHSIRWRRGECAPAVLVQPKPEA